MKRLGLLTLLSLLMAGCGPSPQDVEATANAAIAMTQTARPTQTPVPTATRTPRPTPTMKPTPAPIGVAVPYGQLEITVLDARNRDTMHIGDIEGRYYVYYYAPDGAAIVDLAVLVHNTDPTKTVTVNWGDVFIVEENGDQWYPLWAKMQSMEVANLADPYSIGISSEEVDPEAEAQFVKDTYLRLVYMVSDKANQTMRFHIEGSSPISFQVKK